LSQNLLVREEGNGSEKIERGRLRTFLGKARWGSKKRGRPDWLRIENGIFVGGVLFGGWGGMGKPFMSEKPGYCTCKTERKEKRPGFSGGHG